MKPQVTLVLICFLLFEAFQASAALQCYGCINSLCTPKVCSTGEDRCYSGSVIGVLLTGKGCATKAQCDTAGSAGNNYCCSTDLCNGGEGITLSLLMMLVPLLSSVLFF